MGSNHVSFSCSCTSTGCACSCSCSTLTAGAIVGIVFAVLFGLAMFAWWMRWRRRRFNRTIIVTGGGPAYRPLVTPQPVVAPPPYVQAYPQQQQAPVAYQNPQQQQAPVAYQKQAPVVGGYPQQGY